MGRRYNPDPRHGFDLKKVAFVTYSTGSESDLPKHIAALLFIGKAGGASVEATADLLIEAAFLNDPRRDKAVAILAEAARNHPEAPLVAQRIAAKLESLTAARRARALAQLPSLPLIPPKEKAA